MNNATTAINTVVKNIDIQKGDRVYCLNVTYGKNQKPKKHAIYANVKIYTLCLCYIFPVLIDVES